MALNKNKFELMTHKLTTDNSNLKLLKNLPFLNEFTSYSISNQINLTPSTSVKDLGIHIDTKLSWDHHIVELTRQSRQICGWILSVFYSREKCLMLTLFKSLVRSKMEYCCEIFDPYLIKNINSLEQIQRSFTNRIQNMKHLNYWERLANLNIFSLQRRREKIIIIHFWKILNNFYPNSMDITFKEQQRTKSIKAILKPLPKLKGRAQYLNKAFQ